MTSNSHYVYFAWEMKRVTEDSLVIYHLAGSLRGGVCNLKNLCTELAKHIHSQHYSTICALYILAMRSQISDWPKNSDST